MALRTLSREELYTLVWQTPMSRLAKTFGLSDVGLRKICTMHSIPTPSLGYWAKLAHGKRVLQPPLPPGKKDIEVRIAARLPKTVSDHLAAAAEIALEYESKRTPIVVPPEPPTKLHPVAAATAKAIRAAKVDFEGFKHAKTSNAVAASIANASLDRALCIIDAFARATEERGLLIEQHEGGVTILVDGVPFWWQFYEIKHRKPHQPTKDELKAQARRDQDRARWPSLYASSSDTKVYASWDYFPSGRLGMKFVDTTRHAWDRGRVVGRWHDRETKRLEDYLGQALAALAVSAITIKHRLSAEAERERWLAEEQERRRLQQESRERAERRRAFIFEKADKFAQYERLSRFAKFLEREVQPGSLEPVDRLVNELRVLVDQLDADLARGSLQNEIDRLQLFSDDELVNGIS